MDDRIDPDAWLAQLRTEAAAAARARQGGLGDRLAESATWLGTLVDLAERDGLVVELGCGSGHLTRHLLESAHRVIATDASPAMLALARRQAPARGCFQTVLAEGDLVAARRNARIAAFLLLAVLGA